MIKVAVCDDEKKGLEEVSLYILCAERLPEI